MEEIDVLHRTRESLERREHAPQEQKIRSQDENKAGDEDERFHEPDRRADRHRRDQKGRQDKQEEDGVGRKHAPEQSNLSESGHHPYRRF